MGRIAYKYANARIKGAAGVFRGWGAMAYAAPWFAGQYNRFCSSKRIR